MVAQAHALGATAVISSTKEVAFRLARIEEAQKAGQRELAAPPALTDCAAAFASMFLAVRAGKPISLADATRATSEIIDRVERSGLTCFLDEVRRYHEGTFQHCLLVTGVAVGFGIEIGCCGVDVSRLGVAATLHDIGKACIPLPILDKPGRLDAAEDEIMKRHPVTGYDLLKDIPGMTPEILDGVRHHHEYLDGSGYPDRLSSSKISDLVRLLTISDIFAALIEVRPYRAPMPRPAAYQILCDMNGKLEGPLVKAFRNVALVA
jgi:putative nucleotidyltransferase with HDIG domain